MPESLPQTDKDAAAARLSDLATLISKRRDIPADVKAFILVLLELEAQRRLLEAVRARHTEVLLPIQSMLNEPATT